MGKNSLPTSNQKPTHSFLKRNSSTNLTNNNNNSNNNNTKAQVSTNRVSLKNNTINETTNNQPKASYQTQQIFVNNEPQPIPNSFSYSVKRPPPSRPGTNETRPKKASTANKEADDMDQDPDATGHDSESYDEELTSSESSTSEGTQNKASSKNANTNQNQQLPAIKFLISQTTIEKFNDHKKIVNEIYRCHGKHMRKHIKFVTYKNNLIIIATDNQDVHDLLSSSTEWPVDAFAKGIKFLKKQQPNSHQLIIKGVDPTTNLSDEDIISELNDQGITNAERIINKQGNPTTVMKLTVSNKRAYEKLLNNYVTIDLQRFRTSPAKTVIQCFNCQKVGHTKFNCPNEIRCLRCGGNHSHKECNNQLKCSNCGSAHTSCSRSCPYLKEEAKQKQENRNVQIMAPSSAQFTTTQSIMHSRQRTYAQATTSNINQRHPPTIEQDIDKKLEDISNQIQVGSAKFVASLISTSLDISQQNAQEDQRPRVPEHFTNLKNQLQNFIQNEIKTFIQNQLDIFMADMKLTIQNQFQQLSDTLNQKLGHAKPVSETLNQQPNYLQQQSQQNSHMSSNTYITGTSQQLQVRLQNRGKQMPGYGSNADENNLDNQHTLIYDNDE